MKKRLWIVAAVLAVLVVCGMFLASYLSDFFEAGVHIFGRFAHIELQENCYFITPNENTVTGESVFTVSGYMFDNSSRKSDGSREGARFDGHMNVAAYPISFEDGYSNHWGSFDKDYIALSCQGIKAVRPDCDTFYNVHISRANPDIIVIYIYQENADTIMAVCGETKEDALSNYQTYLEEFREWTD